MIEEKPITEPIEKIVKEFQGAGTTKWNAVKIIKELENQRLTGKKLKETAFELLKKLDPQAAKVYESFQKMKVYNSQEEVREFDRGNIIHSLLKETSISRTVAEKIGTEVENKLKDLNLDYINTSLIREVAAVKLLEFGQENVHKEYTRIGVPVFEVQNNLHDSFLLSREVLREFNWLKAIPKKIRELHFKTVIHVMDAHNFCTKPFSAKFYFNPKKQVPEKQVLELGARIFEQRKAVSRGICIDSLNTSFAPALEKCSKRKIKLVAELVLLQLNESFKESPKEHNIVCLDLFDPGKLKQSTGQKERAIEFAQNIIKTSYLHKESYNFSIALKLDSKYKLKLVEKKQRNGFYYLNCVDKNISLHSGLIPVENSGGISAFVSINLPKVALGSLTAIAFIGKIEQISFELAYLFKLKSKYLKEKTKEFMPAVELFGLEQAAHVLKEENFAKFFEKVTNSVKKGFKEKIVITSPQEKKAFKNFFDASKEDAGAKQFENGFVKNVFLEKKFAKVFVAANEAELEEMLSKKVPAIYLNSQTKK